MEELFLTSVLSYYELDVINKKNINVSIFITEVIYFLLITISN